MHNKEYALKLVQDKLNGLNNYSYSKISLITGFTKRHLIRLSQLIPKKDISSILIHGLTNKPSNNSPSKKEIEFIKNYKNKYPIISITQFRDIYHEDVIYNPSMTEIIKDHHLKVRSYSFFETLYEKFKWIKPIKHQKALPTHKLRMPSLRRGILIMIDGTPHDWFQSNHKSSLTLAIDDATGEALCGWFMPTECLEGYVHMLEILVTKYGIPKNIYCDRKTSLLRDFKDICKDLGINLIVASSPQAKGKVEKWNNTIHNRLVNDIKRYNIKTVSELNIFFNNYYCNYLNHKYAYEPIESIQAFLPATNLDLSNIFCIRRKRTILNGNMISWNNNYYQIINKEIYPGTLITVLENILTKVVKVKYLNTYYETKQIKKPLKLNNRLTGDILNND